MAKFRISKKPTRKKIKPKSKLSFGLNWLFGKKNSTTSKTNNPKKRVAHIHLNRKSKIQKNRLNWRKKTQAKNRFWNSGPSFWWYQIKKITDFSKLKNLWSRILIFIHWGRWHKFIFGYLIITLVVFSFGYITLWDRFFLIRNFEIQYNAENSSYLSNQQAQNLIESWQTNKLYGVFPENQYWFATDKNLTRIAKNTQPAVQDIQILNRKWPNKISLEITTQDILLTLKVQVDKDYYYLRIDTEGRVINLDKASINYNLVTVDLAISDIQEKDLLNLEFANSPDIFNKLWFTIKMRDHLTEQGFEVLGIRHRTLVDTDVIYILNSGTELIFDSQSTSWDNYTDKIDFFLGYENWQQKLNNNNLKYIDFRINRRLFICQRDRDC